MRKSPILSDIVTATTKVSPPFLQYSTRIADQQFKKYIPKHICKSCTKAGFAFFYAKMDREGNLIPAVSVGCTLTIESAAGEIPGIV
jgi:hypothetical protein